ncbi:hypothetical protein BaRGS_00003459 [Batillaria attramentaria]|uniref:CCHC-type domain-containing protein n=2 Tax=Batillaria attramentaria TaxID=370345 RepID=A0ABD0LJG3_9CAEN
MSDNENEKVDVKSVEDLRRTVAQLQVQLETDRKRLASSQRTENSTVFLSDQRRIARFTDRPQEPGDVSLQDWLDDIRAAITFRGMRDNDHAAFILEHLGGKARREIIGRGGAKLSGEQIFSILEHVFGDGASIARIQSQFYSYRQGEEDLLTCSHNLATLADKIEAVEKDTAFSKRKNDIMKERLAEAVRDRDLRRELRRLNTEIPSLSFFDLRDRAMQWFGSPDNATCVSRIEEKQTQSELWDLLKRQSEQIEQQQLQIQQLTAKLQTLSRDRPTEETRRCYNCNASGHLRRHCPQRQTYNQGGRGQVRETNAHRQHQPQGYRQSQQDLNTRHPPL